jgi:hypothetical protein
MRVIRKAAPPDYHRGLVRPIGLTQKVKPSVFEIACFLTDLQPQLAGQLLFLR